jgi:hypothetical protein
VANSWSHLGRALADLERHAEAEAAFRSSLAIWADLAGENHPMALRALRNVAESLSRQGKDEAAAATFARLEGRR